MTKIEKGQKKFNFPENGIYLDLGSDMNPGQEGKRFVFASGRMNGKNFVTQLVKMEKRVASMLMNKALDGLTAGELTDLFQAKLRQKKVGQVKPCGFDVKSIRTGRICSDNPNLKSQVKGSVPVSFSWEELYNRPKPKPVPVPDPDPFSTSSYDEWQAWRMKNGKPNPNSNMSYEDLKAEQGRRDEEKKAELDLAKNQVKNCGCSYVDNREECDKYPNDCLKCKYLVTESILGMIQISHLCQYCAFDQNDCYYQNHGGPTENFKCGNGPYKQGEIDDDEVY